MTFQSLLINTATIQRATLGAADGYGNPAKTWNNYLVNQACRRGPSKGRTVWIDQQDVVVDFIFYFNDIDITEEDRVIFDGETYRVLFVEHCAAMVEHHLEVMVQIVRPA